ncbi:MAG: hypothetical protein MUD10_05370, partial [Candidatus Pacebacteria bacterium]|nr:hypothetical protein [Candidatus Paceibacterota bacterium]
GKNYGPHKFILGAMTADFIALVATVFIPPLGVMLFGDMLPYMAFVQLALFVSLGIVLVVFTEKGRVSGKLRGYLFLAGFSAVGFAVFALLHNLILAAFPDLFTAQTEEPFFFLLATVVCPLAFIVGATGSAARLLEK